MTSLLDWARTLSDARLISQIQFLSALQKVLSSLSKCIYDLRNTADWDSRLLTEGKEQIIVAFRVALTGFDGFCAQCDLATLFSKRCATEVCMKACWARCGYGPTHRQPAEVNLRSGPRHSF